MVKRVSILVAAATAACATAGKGKTTGKGSSAGSVLSGIMSAAGMGAALGAEAGPSVHPLYHSTHNDLSSLLTKPCTKEACPMQTRFNTWANEHKKPYVTQHILGDDVKISATSGSEDEYERRFAAFADNVKHAHGYNIKSQGRSVHGITKFMDMTEQEFMKQRGGLRVDEAELAEFKKLPKFESAASSTPFMRGQKKMKESGSKDWSADGLTTPVKDQGQCGSCWAFSTTEQVESMAIKQGITDPDGENYVLGPQELVSCDHNGDMGCNGGLPTNALKWLEKHALDEESAYPYTSGITQQSGKCTLKKNGPGVIEVTSFKTVSDGAESEDDMVQYLLKEGPLSVGVDANGAWQTYIGGVMTADQCEGEMDHAVQAVGVDTESYEPSIKVRNSWGPDWGEDGFIRLAQGTNTCGVANMAVTADVQSTSAKGSAAANLVV